MNRKTIHPAVKSILQKILDEIETALKQGETQASLAEKSNITHQQMNRLIRGLRGSNLTLNMVCKIWEGLGKRFDQLFPGPIPEDLMVKTQEIYQQSDEEVFKQFVELLHNQHLFSEDLDKLRELVSVTHQKLMGKINT
ncbi:MAG: helix-turn-helix domain-containing protein [Desulfobacteraceae bacterium]